MNTMRIMLATILCVAAISCQNDILGTSDTNSGKESVKISTETQTKTSLNGTEIHWTNDDVIAVFDNSGVKNEFTLTQTNGQHAEFTGNVTDGTTQIYAVYPYELAKSIQEGIIKVTLPTEQTSKANTFAEEHNISVAKAEKTPGIAEISGVLFKNTCALLKFTIPSYLSDVKKVTVSSNTVIAGEMTIDYNGDAPVCTVSENGSKSITMSGVYEADSTFWFVLAPATLDGIAINVETAQGTYSMSSDNQFEMAAGQYRNLGTLNLEAVSAQGATAVHTYTDGILTGTEVKVNLGIPAATASYITALNLEVKNAEGTVVRTLAKDNAAATETIAADTQWPYLPKGDYTVSGTYTLSGVTHKNIEAIAFSITESPVFEMKSVTAYTSYNKYLAGDTAGANSLDGSTIYGISADITVSDEILNNSNYNGGITVTDNGTSVQAGDLAGSSSGSHTIKATYTLDGVTVEGSVQVEVTGIPYSYNFYKSSLEATDAAGWTRNGNTGYMSDLLWLSNNVGGGYGWVATPPVYVPERTIKAEITVITKFYNVYLFGSAKTMTVYLGVTNNKNQSVRSSEHSCKGSNNTSSTKDLRTISAEVEIPAGEQYISIDHNNTLATASYFYLSSYKCIYK